MYAWKISKNLRKSTIQETKEELNRLTKQFFMQWIKFERKITYFLGYIKRFSKRFPTKRKNNVYASSCIISIIFSKLDYLFKRSSIDVGQWGNLATKKRRFPRTRKNFEISRNSRNWKTMEYALVTQQTITIIGSVEECEYSASVCSLSSLFSNVILFHSLQTDNEYLRPIVKLMNKCVVFFQ